MVDPTPLIRLFETVDPDHPTVPDDPTLSLVNDLIDDYADEWPFRSNIQWRQA
jgi:hypothetical protein